MTTLKLLVLAAVIAATACTPTPNRDLTELVVRDSIYLVPETLEPYTGDVFRRFPDESGKTEIEGHLTEGEWDGEIVVYHVNGRVRYMGSFARGEKCGAWTENMDAEPPESIYEQLVDEVESMGLYPSCDSIAAARSR